MSAIAEAQARRKLWSRDEVPFLQKMGLLEERPFELLEGKVVYKMAKNPAHGNAVRRCQCWAEVLFGAEFIRTQDSLILDLFGSALRLADDQRINSPAVAVMDLLPTL